MNRFHVHLNVADLPASIRFYNELFGAEPTVTKHDYAKWMLEDPRINFAISNTGRAPGIDHLGIQVDSGDELVALGQRLDAAGGSVVPEDAAEVRRVTVRNHGEEAAEPADRAQLARIGKLVKGVDVE